MVEEASLMKKLKSIGPKTSAYLNPSESFKVYYFPKDLHSKHA